MGSKNFLKIVKWDAKARETYAYDYQNVSFGKRDDWTSYADSVLAGKSYKDDADGLAATVLDLLHKDQIQQKALYRAAVDAVGDGKINHFVGLAWEGSKWLVVGDLYYPCYPYSQMKHRLCKVSNWGSTEWIENLPF